MGGGSALERLTASQNLALGMVAGVGTKMLNYPLLSTKNAVQQGLPISFNPKVVYRGLPMACLNLGGTTAVQFWFTGFFQKLLPGNEIGAAFLGGVFSGIPCSLWELTMIQQQRFGGTVWGTPLGLVRQHGPLALARGLTMTMGRESLYTMAMLGVTPALKRYIADNYQLEGNTALAIGALSGSFFSATITHPMDTIKTCMQGDVGREKYTNVPQTGRLLAQEYGVAQGLFKGLSWRIGLIATTFFLVNKFKEVLAPMVFPEDDDDGGAPPS